MKRINWYAVGAWGTIAGFWMAVAIGVLPLLTACTTHQQLTEHHVRTIVADMMATQAQQDTHVSNDSYRLDSAFAALKQQMTAEWNAREQHTETVTETVTTAIDSLGRELRTEQRTTTRTLSREEQQRIAQQLQQTEQRWQSRYDHLDSLYRTLESRVQVHWQDSTATQSDLVKQTNPAPALTWWQRTWSWLKGLLLGAAIAIIYIVGRRHLKRLNNMN